MKRKASVSDDETIIRRLRNDPDFAAEYLKAALEDEDEPRVPLIALRHLAQAQGIAKVAGIERESLYRALSDTAILVSLRSWRSPRQSG
jgi:probable addiction module antidote protein